MKLLFVGCMALGSLVVFQPLLNRMISEQKGLAVAVWLNALILFSGSSLLFLAMLALVDKSPGIFSIHMKGPWHWWYILPGLMGLALVTGMPLMIKGLGAFSTVMALLCGQLFTGYLWDLWTEGPAQSQARLVGLLLALSGAYLSIRPTT